MPVPDITFEDEPNIQAKEFEFAGKKYLVTEPMGSAIIRFKTTVLKGARIVDGQISGVDGVSEIDYQLVSDCLQVTDGGTLKQVKITDVKALPDRVIRKIAAWCKSASGLDTPEDSQEQIKLMIDKLQAKLAKVEAGESDAKN